MSKQLSLVLLIGVLLVIIAAVVALIILIAKPAKSSKQSKKEKNNSGKKADGKADTLSSKEVDMVDYLSTGRKNAKDICCADGIDTSQLGYVVINDGGRDVYECALYADKLPKRSTFAVTYAELMNFPNCTTSVFWNPISSAESQKLLDKRVIALGSELIAAEGKDPNRARRLSAKLTECEEWAKVIESGLNVFFKVAFLFVLRADSLEHLNDACADLYSIGKEKGIDIVGCYGAHAEGILAAAPLNKMMKVGKGPFKDLIVKYHIMDKTSLGDTFNHTESFFSHKNGILGGRNMFTHQPVLIDPYDKSHSGYNMCISGITGAGKSAGLKMYSSRWMEVFGYRMAFIDYDSPNGAEGEYVPLVRTEGGVVFQLKHGSDNILNIFDIDVELEYLPSIRKEVRKLNLMEKCADCTNIILSMIKDGREVDSFDTDVYLTKIVSDTVVGLYAAKGIEEGHPDSIYEDGQVYEGGRISSGRVRKAMPTLHEFFISLLNRRRFNTDELQDKAFSE